MLHKHYVILLNPVIAYLILCGFPPFFLERHLVEVISETRRAH